MSFFTLRDGNLCWPITFDRKGRTSRVTMQDDRYRIGETLRLIGKRLDQAIPMSETPDRIVELLRLLSEIDVPARGPKIEKTIKVERMRGAAR